MKGFSFLFVFGLVASTQASRLPLCSAVCFTNAIATTNCKASDTQCICLSDTFTSAVAECVEQRCTGDDKDSTLETAEEFCDAAGVHRQLKKRDAEPEAEPEAFGPPGGGGGWGPGSFFKGFPGGGRPNWGGPAPASPTVTVVSTPKEPTPQPKPPIKWVPNFHTGNKEWWKQQSAEWWKENGFSWWKANGHHFPGAQWWKGKDQGWWQNNGHDWWKGPSGARGGNWGSGKPWWPAAPSPTQPAPQQTGSQESPPSTTAPEEPSQTNPAQDWPDWPDWLDWESSTEPTSTPTQPTATSTPSPTQPDPDHHHHPGPTYTSEPWNPYNPPKPVQTVIPAGW